MRQPTGSTSSEKNYRPKSAGKNQDAPIELRKKTAQRRNPFLLLQSINPLSELLDIVMRHF